MKSLSGKTALITGGSRGIGAAIASRLASEGADIAITYGKSRQEAEKVAESLAASGVRARAYRADASDPASMPDLVKKVVGELGGIDMLINNAGVFSTGMVGETAPGDYERVCRINVDAVFLLTNAVVPVMKPGSRIVNISSALGERATGPGLSVYCGSKFAVTGFSRAWAKDLGAKGILVNAVQPGPIDTEMNPETSESADFMKSQTALGRYGRPEEIAGVVAFLVSADASYVTGACINVDGGWNA